MNRTHRTVWNETLGTWVAASEHARNRSKRSGATVVAVATMLLAVGAEAQNVTISGSNGSLGGDSCNSVYVPSECATEYTTPLAPVSTAAWTHTAAPAGVLIGANRSNSNSGPAVTGNATVTAGGTANTGRLWVGFENNATGSLNISGAGSRWTAGGIGVIGHYGTGSLTITDGGYLRSTNNYVGFAESGVGTVLVSGIAANGTRSRWEGTNNTLYLGGGFVGPVTRPGGNGTVTIDDGGWITSTGGGLRVGQAVDGVGLMTVRGVHSSGVASSFTTTGATFVGNFGTGTLNIENGGLVSNTSGAIGGGAAASDTSLVGQPTTYHAPTAGVGIVNVSGMSGTTRSTWLNSGALRVGHFGTGALNVTGGALVSNTDASVGGSNQVQTFFISVTPPYQTQVFIPTGNGEVNVSGVNGSRRSTWANSGQLAVGHSGSGLLNVLDGGQVTAASMVIGGGNTGSYTFADAGGNLQSGTFTPTGTGTVNVSGANGGTASELAIAGDLTVGKQGRGTLTLSDNGLVSAGAVTLASAAGSTGTLNLGAAAGSAAGALGTLSTPALAFGAGTGVLNFNHTSSGYDFNVAISGGGLGNSAINQLAGVTNLTGDSSGFSGTTNVTGGTLRVNGTLGNATSQVIVGNGATLGGAGTIGGNVAIGDGVLSPGNSPGTLTINGNLALSSASTLNYELGAANTVGGPLNDLTVVNGNLTLDGTLNVTQSAGGTYGAGVYRLIDYAGTLTDNGLALGSMPAGTDNYVQTSIANQVNLVTSRGLTLNWWDGDAGGRNDGAIAGGNGTWTAIGSGATADRWTQADGQINAPYQNGAFAIFAGAPGTVTVDNSAGQVRVSGMQFATSGYRIEGGPVELTGGTNAIRVGDGTSAGGATTATIASALTGAGKLDKVDLGTLVLTGANTYTGGTTVSGGTLQLGDGGASGSITGDVTNNAKLAFDRSDASTFAGTISGTGQVVQAGSGSTTLSGANTYSGGTLIDAGTLIGSAGSFGGGTITDNAALVIEQAGDATMTNVINGTGTLTKTGSGTLNYVGTGSLSGATTVAQGTLAVNGSLANSAVSVASGATLAGNGTVGTATVAAGGTVSPGNGGIGTLTVNGDFTQAAGSTYQVQVSPGTQVSDRINVLGSADVSGATLNVARTSGGNYALDTKYTVLNATGGVTGTYGQLIGDTRTAFVQLKDSYDANNVYLTAEQYRSFGSAGGTRNQIATGLALDRLPPSSALANAVAWLPNDFAARTAFDQLSGEIHASLKSATVEDSRFVREAALLRLRAADCAPGAAALPTRADTQHADDQAGGVGCTPAGAERVVWGQAFGSWGHMAGDGNAQGIDRDIGGFFVGADTALAGGWRVGALGGYSRSTMDSDGRGTAKTDSYHLGLYGGNTWGATSLRLGAAYAWNRLATHRSVFFSGYGDAASAKYDSRTAQLFGEVGHRIDLGSTKLEPFAQLAHVRLSSDGFSERGGLSALHGGGDGFSSTFATLGVRATAQLGSKTRLTGMLGWRHAFGDTVPESTHAFAGSLASFTVGGVPLARNVAVLEAGVETELAPNLTLGASYSGQFGSGLRDHGFKLNLAYRF
ncbi:MAG TPA: autotransporter domain-containing protein [Burkholderiaceae bacterium]|nr:autotransporter domain-containing protein [Burkholderiaceae bacterium]